MTDGSSPESPWFTTQESARYAKRHEKTILHALGAGELEGNQSRPGAKWFVHREALDAWIRGEPAAVKGPAVSRRAS